jgi:hypothetical protein
MVEAVADVPIEDGLRQLGLAASEIADDVT